MDLYFDIKKCYCPDWLRTQPPLEKVTCGKILPFFGSYYPPCYDGRHTPVDVYYPKPELPVNLGPAYKYNTEPSPYTTLVGNVDTRPPW